MENYHQFRHYRAHGHRQQLLHDELHVGLIFEFRTQMFF